MTSIDKHSNSDVNLPIIDTTTPAPHRVHFSNSVHDELTIEEDAEGEDEEEAGESFEETEDMLSSHDGDSNEGRKRRKRLFRRKRKGPQSRGGSRDKEDEGDDGLIIMPRLPVLIVPGFMSSGLTILNSPLGNKYVGQRVWLNLSALGFSSLYQGSAICLNEAKKQSGQNEYDEELHEEYEKQVVYKSSWVQHMSLMDDMHTERTGVVVRPIDGLEGVDYLTPGTFTSHLSYVFGPVIRALTNVGYVEGVNLDAAPYDWRVPPALLERRDCYFTGLMHKVERLYEQAGCQPVVLLCHSLGCKVGHYFLNFVLTHPRGGRSWIDRYVHTYMPVGAPHLGAPKSIRATVDGNKMGLDTFLSDEEALILGRSFGSGPWMMPRLLPSHPHPLSRDNNLQLPPISPPPSVFLRREGTLMLSLSSSLDMEALLRRRKTRPKKVRLVITLDGDKIATKFYSLNSIIRGTAASSSPRRNQVEITEKFVFPTPPYHPSGLLRLTLEEPGIGSAKRKERKKKDEIDRSALGSLYHSCICCPLRWTVNILLFPIKLPYCLCHYATRATLASADVTARAVGSSTTLASSDTINVLNLLSSTNKNGEDISIGLVPSSGAPKKGVLCWKKRFPATSVKVRVRWAPPPTIIRHVQSESDQLCKPIAALDDLDTSHDTPHSRAVQGGLDDTTEHDYNINSNIPRLVHRKKEDVTYDILRGDQLLHAEGLDSTLRLVHDWYDMDPYGPHTTSSVDAPPISRVHAVYGVNLPTEVGAIYRRAPGGVLIRTGRQQKLHVVDKAARVSSMAEGGKGGEEYDIRDGIIYETSKTSQVVFDGTSPSPDNTNDDVNDDDDKKHQPTEEKSSFLSNNNNVTVVHRSGDGTVPYWSLQHCRTWDGPNCRVTVDEIDGAEHREILANAKFHKILADYVTFSIKKKEVE